MISMPVRPKFAKKDKPVRLSQSLPNDRAFGNKNEIAKGATGYITSFGFQTGMLEVYFPLYQGDERVRFNEISAEKFLECDPYL